MKHFERDGKHGEGASICFTEFAILQVREQKISADVESTWHFEIIGYDKKPTLYAEEWGCKTKQEAIRKCLIKYRELLNKEAEDISETLKISTLDL